MILDRTIGDDVEIHREVVLHDDVFAGASILVRADLDPGWPGSLAAAIVDDGVVHDAHVARAEERDAVPVVDDHDVVLDHPILEKPVEAADALGRAGEGLSRVVEVDEDVAAELDPASDAPARRAVLAEGPGLKEVVVMIVDVVGVLDDVVFEDAVVADASEAVAREIPNEVVAHEGVGRVVPDRDAVAHVPDRVVEDAGIRCANADAGPGAVRPITFVPPCGGLVRNREDVAADHRDVS